MFGWYLTIAQFESFLEGKVDLSRQHRCLVFCVCRLRLLTCLGLPSGHVSPNPAGNYHLELYPNSLT
eukprot:g41190.t1